MRAPYGRIWEANRPRDERGRWQAGGKAIVCGRRYCPRCGRWRYVCDFPPRKDGPPRSLCRTCRRISDRGVLDRLTPAQREARREYERIYKEAKRRQLGIPPQNFHHRVSVIDRPERKFLDPGPIIQEIQRSGISHEVLAARAGISERAVTRIMTGESRHIRTDNADKIAVALDIPLALLCADWLDEVA